MADIFNRIIIIGGPYQDKGVPLWVGFAIPLIAFIAVVIAAIVYDCYIICKDKKRNQNSNLWPSAAEWAKLLIKGFTLIGGVLYFVGDNLETIKNDDVVDILSPALTISGVVILRIFTRMLRTLQNYCKPKQRMPDAFNLCSPNRDTETHTLVVVYVNLLTFLIEFDTVLSIVLQRVDTNSSDNFCHSMEQKALVWSFYGSMVGVFFIIQSIIVIIIIISAKRKSHKFTITPKLCNTWKCYVWNFVLFIVVFLAVASNLLAEIPQFLQCSIPDHQSIIARIALSLFALAVCFVVFIGFFFRNRWGCVRVKGELEAVKITQTINNNKIEVCYKHSHSICKCEQSKEHTCTYTCTVDQSKYDYGTNETELYRGDVEGIVNFVNGPVKIHTCECTKPKCTCSPLPVSEYGHVMTSLQSTTSVLEVRKDLKKIEKLHMFGDQPYLVMRTNDDPTIHVYKVRVLKQGESLDDVTRGWTEDEGQPLEVGYEKNGIRHTWNIHTYHRKQDGREEERKCAVEYPQRSVTSSTQTLGRSLIEEAAAVHHQEAAAILQQPTVDLQQDQQADAMALQQLQQNTCNGSQTAPASTCSGSQTAPASTYSGSPTAPASTYSGSQTAPASTCNGSQSTCSGSPTAPASTCSGSQTAPASTYSGSPTAPASTCNGSQTAPASTCNGSQTAPASTYSGSPTAPASTCSGSQTATASTYSGSPTAPASTCNGSQSTCSGSQTAPASTCSGSPTAPASTCSGSQTSPGNNCLTATECNRSRNSY